MKKVDRLKAIIRFAVSEGVAKNQKDLGKKLGYNNESYFSQVINLKVDQYKEFLSRLKKEIPSLNEDWVETGDGSMIITSPTTTISGTNIVNINSGQVYQGGVTPINTAEEPTETLPVIPRHIYEDTEVDVLEYVTENVVPTSPRIQQLPPYSMCYQVYSDELIPEIVPGDRLYIKEHADVRKIIDGKPYVLETSTNGLMLRTLYKGDTGLRASTKSQKYRDEYIPYEDIVRAYRILGLLRANL